MWFPRKIPSVGHCNLFFLTYCTYFDDCFSFPFFLARIDWFHSFLRLTQEIIKNLEKFSGSYTEKLQLLQKGWRTGGLLVEKCSRDASENLFSKLLTRTWPVVLVVSCILTCFESDSWLKVFFCLLQGEWNDVPSEEKERLRCLIEKMIENSSEETPMVLKCKYLFRIFNRPWADPCLEKILTAHPDLRPEQGE